MDGLLLVDKPGGMSSHDVVNKVRRLFDEKSVGHLGTLDPLATGVLPLMLGRYTRLARYFGKRDKEYSGRIRFGFATDTYDCDGTAMAEPVEVALDAAWLERAVAGMRGGIEQMPPLYSAKKVKGVPAHRLARRGETPELAPVQIHVAHFEAAIEKQDTATFRATVSSGGYIRCLAHSLGRELGCGAHLIELRRVRAGEFLIEQAVTLDALAEMDAAQRLQTLLPASQILPEIPGLTVDEGTVVRLRNGVQVNLPEFSGASLVRVLTAEGDIAAIARRMAGTLFAPQTVLA
jgi:tRNA pseudouridine55 synthase